MNKKILMYIALACVGLTLLFAFIGIFVNGGAGMAMCILAVIFSAAALTCLLIHVFYKRSAATVTTPADAVIK